jgi:hypothetical protein
MINAPHITTKTLFSLRPSCCHTWTAKHGQASYKDVRFRQQLQHSSSCLRIGGCFAGTRTRTQKCRICLYSFVHVSTCGNVTHTHTHTHTYPAVRVHIRTWQRGVQEHVTSRWPSDVSMVRGRQFNTDILCSNLAFGMDVCPCFYVPSYVGHTTDWSSTAKKSMQQIFIRI